MRKTKKQRNNKEKERTLEVLMAPPGAKLKYVFVEPLSSPPPPCAPQFNVDPEPPQTLKTKEEKKRVHPTLSWGCGGAILFVACTCQKSVLKFCNRLGCFDMHKSVAI